MTKSELLEKLNGTFPNSKFTTLANAGDWSGAQIAAGAAGLDGIWYAIGEVAGLETDYSTFISNEKKANSVRELTILDYFAAQALAGMLACPNVVTTQEIRAVVAYKLAQEMMHVRDGLIKPE